MEPEQDNKLAAKIGRDRDYRIAALNNAIIRAGQDGGLEGPVDALAIAELYYNWLLGKETTEKPKEEKMLRGE